MEACGEISLEHQFTFSFLLLLIVWSMNKRGGGVAPPPNNLEYEQERGWGSSS